jgi:hypothetical protein
LSSTTRPGQSGQIVVIFALSITVLMLIAALAFDAGMMVLERRDEQNAADAAALAGSRYVAENTTTARTAAIEMATANGYTHAAGNQQVVVNIPPSAGRFRGLPGFIEVVIHNRRPSIFAGVMGVAGWPVSARAVAANQKGLDLPFSMLALHPTQCSALKVTGTGIVLSAGSVQVNSECPANALDVGGSGSITVTADGAVCNAVGGIDEHGNGDLTCTQVENSYAIADPLQNLAEPPVPAYPAAVVRVGGSGAIPRGCPGSTQPSTTTNVRGCGFNTAGATWRIFPGLYPGGIDVQKGTVYMEPGIYYIAGGGFRVRGGTVWSVPAGGVITGSGVGFGGGVMIFNSESPVFTAECAAGTAPGGACLDIIQLNGSMAPVNLKPLADGSMWDGLVIYGDRHLSLAGDEFTLNGSSSPMEVAGTIYLPTGDVKVNGSTSSLILDQVIASTYQINGSGGTVDIRYRSGVTARVSGLGLVE